MLLPTESDGRDYMVSDIEPIFEATPALKGTLGDGDEEGMRNTLLSRRFAGGYLKIVASRAPRNLRRHTARILLCDEVDGMETTAEGSPIALGEQRTLTFADRKIIIGSTPVFTETSVVIKTYAESDQRVFEVPCPECGEFNEIRWAHIVWPKDIDQYSGQVIRDRPEEAAYECPNCKSIVPHACKRDMVYAGRWRQTNPDVQGHAGFRLNALVSLHANASWDKLAALFLKAKDDVTELQPFTNTVLAEGWSSPGMVNEGALAARAEEWGINNIPAEVLILTAGCDVQDDRVEISVLGWTKTAECLILGHIIIWGSYVDQSTWDEVDEMLRSKWRHPLGDTLKIDAACIDAGDGDHWDMVLNFCIPKLGPADFRDKGHVRGSAELPRWPRARRRPTDWR